MSSLPAPVVRSAAVIAGELRTAALALRGFLDTDAARRGGARPATAAPLRAAADRALPRVLALAGELGSRALAGAAHRAAWHCARLGVDADVDHRAAACAELGGIVVGCRVVQERHAGPSRPAASPRRGRWGLTYLARRPDTRGP